MTNEIKLIDRKQAAKWLGIDTKTLNKLVEMEVIQSYKVGSYRVFILEFLTDFVKYLEDVTEDTHKHQRKSFVG
jgi:hypothetical protein